MVEFVEIVDDEYPETWNPEAEKVIAGEVVDYREVAVEGGQRTAHCAIVEVDGERRTVWLNSVLMTKFKKGHVDAGDLVRIEYLGRRKAYSSEFYYKNYKVSVAHKEA